MSPQKRSRGARPPLIRLRPTAGRGIACLLALLLPARALPTAIAQTDAPSSNWTHYRADPQRSGYTPGTFADTPQLLWSHQPTQPPRPAWPDPARHSYWQQLESITPRVIDDHTFHPVAAAGVVVFASSGDDAVHGLQLSDGQVRWTFTTDGPIRYAPALDAHHLWFGSDDGHVYCLRLDDGTLVWKQHLAPIDRRLPGNGRIISEWPIRTGVAVADGRVYAFAGLYPQQDVWGACLSAADGTVAWKDRFDFSPQGYLLLSRDWLYVPTGRSTPIAVARVNGQTGRAYSGPGGSYSVVSDDELITGPGNDASLQSLDPTSGERLASYAAGQLVTTPRRTYLLGRGTLTALDRQRHAAIGRELIRLQTETRQIQSRLRQHDPAAATADLRQRLEQLGTAIDAQEQARQACRLWTAPCPADHALAATDNLVVAAGSQGLWGFDADTGRPLWQRPTEAPVLGLAIAGQRLLAATDTGQLLAFGSPPPHPPAPQAAAPQEPPSHPPSSANTRTDGRWTSPANDASAIAAVDRLLAEGLAHRGFALVAGLADGRLLQALATRTSLTLVGIDPDPHRVEAVRDQLRRAGLYGRRASVHRVPAGRLPFTPDFANAVLSESALLNPGIPLAWTPAELRRVQRPCGGLLWLDPGQPIERRGPLEGAGAWTHQYGNPANTANSGDQLTSANLDLQWFGGPGPHPMVDRHLRGPAPLGAAGRLFVPGENLVIAVDAYNGTELWSRELPGSQRYAMPYDAGYLSIDPQGRHLAAAVRDECWILDGATGAIRRRLHLPPVLSVVTEASTSPPHHWGYVALTDDHRLIGSAQAGNAARTTPSRDQIHHDYLSEQPVVTSLAIFQMDPDSNEPDWVWQRGTILNPTITVGADALYLVESSATPAGRQPLAALLPEARLVSLDRKTGQPRWSSAIPEDLRACRNILYLQAAGDRLLLSGSVMAPDDDAHYRLACLSAANGEVLWEASHPKGLPGAHYHGEQVHHPVILQDLVVAEPAVYDLATGQRRTPDASPEPWRLLRPGHSCGTLSGAGHCVFFRAANPTVWDVAKSLSDGEPPRKLAPSRPGCWINIIPASGLVLIPEASAGCVCNFSLQTSMAFRSREP